MADAPAHVERLADDEDMARLVRERDEARADARVLAHAYSTDNRPPADVVARALAYPASPRRRRRPA